ncbi:MAG TPA: aldose 1-epimerase [Solirubrobacterales bacterium]|nr:aldose 1-epimerase [Solirubrobacterales bacterium]
MIGEREVEGVATLTLASEGADGIEVAFAPGAGMVACSLRHRGEELLGMRHGLAAYAEQGKTLGIPLLYPWANRLGERRFPVAGREIDLTVPGLRLSTDASGLPIHGLLAGSPGWEVESHESEGDGGVLVAGFDLEAHPGLLAAFPFPHRLRYEARLAGGELTIAVTVLARGRAVPVSFGFHPYFCLPGVEREAWEVEIPVSERLLLDRSMLPIGASEPLSIEPGPLADRSFDDAFAAPRGGAPFVLAGGGHRIEVRLGEGYPFAQVFAPAEDAVIAFEPMTAPTNALVEGGAELPLVAPGGSFTASFAIAVGGA